ncbi:MAG: hypothetical protein MR902_01695 [Campylobacter sp.]|nr:hypothetical protein [Campylobacter sp.]
MLNRLFLPFFVVEAVVSLIFIFSVSFGAFLLESLITFIIGVLIFANLSKKAGIIFSIDSGLSYAFVAVLLMIPGIATDIVAAVIILYKLFSRPNAQNSSNFKNTTYYDKDEIIDVEIIEKEKK